MSATDGSGTSLGVRSGWEESMEIGRHLTQSTGGPQRSQWANRIYHLAILLLLPKVYFGSKETYQIHKLSVTYIFIMLYKKANFVPFHFQIPRNLIVLREISEITAGPSLLPLSAFVLCTDFPTLDAPGKHTAYRHCLCSSTIITLSILFAITLCHQAWLIRQDKLSSFSIISHLLFFPLKKPVYVFHFVISFFFFLAYF